MKGTKIIDRDRGKYTGFCSPHSVAFILLRVSWKNSETKHRSVELKIRQSGAELTSFACVIASCVWEQDTAVQGRRLSLPGRLKEGGALFQGTLLGAKKDE